MRPTPTVLALLRQGCAASLALLVAGCPSTPSSSPAPTVPPPPPGAVTPSEPVAPPAGPAAPAPVATTTQPTATSPTATDPGTTTTPACNNQHQGSQSCPHCDYCPPCGRG